MPGLGGCGSALAATSLEKPDQETVFISDWKEIRLPLCRGIYLLAKMWARHEH